MTTAQNNSQSDFRRLNRLPTQKFVGLTGGIGSGKTTVATLIKEYGYTVLSADDIGRTITETDDTVKASIRAAFGEVYLPDGSLDRLQMAALVFGDTPQHKQNLATLNTIVHPAVWRTVAQETEAHFARGERFVFNETALLFETGSDDWYDDIIVVDASEEVRLQRLSQGRGIAVEEARRRLAAQMPAEEKRKRADYVIDNNGSLEDMRREITNVLRALDVSRDVTRDATGEIFVPPKDKSVQR
jgi:dephospho-CoA kinase